VPDWGALNCQVCIEQRLVPRLSVGEKVALGFGRGVVAIIHRTVRCDSHASQPTVGSAISAGHVSSATVSNLHRTVRCANGVSDAPLDCSVCQLTNCQQQSTSPKKVRNGWMCSVRCVTISPVHPQTKGNKRLPNEDQTAPWSLGAIKGPLGPWSCYHSTLWAHYNSESIRPCYCFAREIFECVLEM
jgi:hypothetical protein